eukprot:3912865-Amphidinium_carterae.1
MAWSNVNDDEERFLGRVRAPSRRTRSLAGPTTLFLLASVELEKAIQRLTRSGVFAFTRLLISHMLWSCLHILLVCCQNMLLSLRKPELLTMYLRKAPKKKLPPRP